MTRYLEIKPGSITEVAIRLRDDYQAFFKKELEKAGKGIAQMTDAEKKAFFNRVDKAYNAKSEATSQDVSQSLATKPKSEPKTTMVVKPGAPAGQEKVTRIPVEKLADYKKKGYVEAESFIPEAKQVDELTSAQKKLPPALQKAIKAKEKNEEQAKNPYAIGMAAAMKATGDKPPLKKSTIVKAHDIAKKIEKNEEVEIISEEEQEKEYEAVTEKGKIKVKAPNAYEASKKAAEHFGLLPQWKKMTNVVKVSPVNEVKEEVEITEGQYKEIDTRKGDLRIAKDKRQALKDKYNAIMANQATGDEDSVADQIQKLDMSIKKQEQELIDIMKKSKDSEKKEAVEDIEEAVGPDRITNLNDKISRLQLSIAKLDKSKPETKTKEAILKSDLNTAKLRLTDIQKQMAASAVKNESKKNYKSYKKSLKKEEETPKKTMTDKPLTKVDVDPKLPTH